MAIDYDKYRIKGAYHWDWYDDPNYAWYKECVDRCVEFCKGSTLDIGCGEALIGSKLLEKGVEEYLGYDIDPDACRLSDPELDVRQTDILEPAAWNLDFEYMVCLNTIEHLKNPEIIVHILKHCITKGAIIITDKATEHKGRYHEHEYTKEELLDLFKEFKPKYFEINSTEYGKPITFIGVEIYK